MYVSCSYFKCMQLCLFYDNSAFVNHKCWWKWQTHLHNMWSSIM